MIFSLGKVVVVVAVVVGVIRVARWGLVEVYGGVYRLNVISRDCFHEVGEKGNNF